MRVLALDLATTTGWSLFEGELGQEPKLLRYGIATNNGPVKENYGKYPYSFVDAADDVGGAVWSVVVETDPDIIVIEEINKARARFSQKLLDFIHYSVLKRLHSYCEQDKVLYISTSEWRKVLGIKLSKEQKKNNSKVNKAKRDGKSKKELGLVGKVNQKHLSVSYSNDKYGLELLKKDDDVSDSICLGCAYFLGATFSDGKK